MGFPFANLLLTTIYLDTRRSLTLANQGGARVKVNEVTLVDCQSKTNEKDVGFVATCVWKVTGSIGHWGHIHQRMNQYHAEFVIRPVDGPMPTRYTRLLRAMEAPTSWARAECLLSISVAAWGWRRMASCMR